MYTFRHVHECVLGRMRVAFDVRFSLFLQVINCYRVFGNNSFSATNYSRHLQLLGQRVQSVMVYHTQMPTTASLYQQLCGKLFFPLLRRGYLTSKENPWDGWSHAAFIYLLRRGHA